jgi:hypothetical protein
MASSVPNLGNSCAKVLGKFDTVQGFWGYWNNINLAKLPNATQLRLLKGGVSPYADDPSNCHGGKWVIACDKGESVSQTWLHCLLALIGEQFRGDYIVGSVLSLGQRNTISILTNAHHRKCIDVTEKDIFNILNISREKMRFARLGGKDTKQRSFTIRLVVSKSVDLTPTADSPSLSPNNAASCSPTGMSPSTSFVLGEEDDISNIPFISHTPGCHSPKLKTVKCGSLPILQDPKNLCIKNVPLNKQKPSSPATSQIVSPAGKNRVMSMSIDSANFRKWRRNELSGFKTSMNLPKLHRRRGRRTSTNDKSAVGSPHRVKSVSPNIPETIPEIKSEDNSKQNLIEPQPQPFVAVEKPFSEKKPFSAKGKGDASTTITSRKPSTFLGLAVSTWIFYFLIGCILLLIGSFAVNDLAKVVPL